MAASIPPLPKVTYPASDVRAMIDSLARVGYDTPPLLSAAGLTRETLDDPDARISCEACGKLFETALRTRWMPNLMLRLAECTPIGSSPLLDYLIVTSDTVGAGLLQLGHYFRLVSNGIDFVFHTGDDPVRVEIVGNVPLNIEFDVAIGIIHMRNETRGRFGAVAASIAHPVDDVDDYARVLGCPVRAPAGWSGWLIAPEIWRLPMPRRDPILRGV